MMADLMIRPTLKFIQLGYILTALVAIGVVVLVYSQTGQPYGMIALFLLLWPLSKHFRQWAISRSKPREKPAG